MSLLDVLLGRKHPPMIGLDISSSSAKLVELGQTANGEFVLERFASEPFEKGWITDGQIEKFDEVAAAVVSDEQVVIAVGPVDRQMPLSTPCACWDDREGIRAAVEHLAELGVFTSVLTVSYRALK